MSHPPARVVSLVPSLTESLFDLGLGDLVVGVTDYCIHPADQIDQLPRLGGPKNIRIDEVIALKPDLVLANREENSRSDIELLMKAGLNTWVTFPKTVRQVIDMLNEMVDIFQSKSAAMKMRTLEQVVEWTFYASGDLPGRRYFCPIWQGVYQNSLLWWMTFNQDTYTHDLLQLLGGENIFSKRVRRYPLAADLGLQEPEISEDRDIRYPCVISDEIISADPEIILLPDEPYPYNAGHRQEILKIFEGTAAARDQRVVLLDGSLITWCGTRLGRALLELGELFKNL